MNYAEALHDDFPRSIDINPKFWEPFLKEGLEITFGISEEAGLLSLMGSTAVCGFFAPTVPLLGGEKSVIVSSAALERFSEDEGLLMQGVLNAQTILGDMRIRYPGLYSSFRGLRESFLSEDITDQSLDVFSASALRAYRVFQHQLELGTEDASKIKALWVISAPGTYFKASKEDRYKDKPWAAWNDRQRVNKALHLGRRLAEVKLGHPLSDKWAQQERELGSEGPLVIYSGRPDEKEALLEAAVVPWLRFPQDSVYPRDKIFVVNPKPPIDNLLDQIRTFRLPPGLEINSGDEIGVIIHAPQAVRLLYNLSNSLGGISERATIRIFPLPTPKIGIPEYPIQEIRGIVYGSYIKNPPVVGAAPYPHK